MDQVKIFLRQCIKYRFWIAVGVSVLLPMIGYFVGSGAYVQATTKREGEIKQADSGVAKYTAPNQPIPEVTRVVTEKKEVLTKDVDATQRKLYEIQEPLLRWPEVVESRFREWGRKFPENVDPGVVRLAIIDFGVAYPDFVKKVYQTCKPWNPEDGSGIVLAPDEAALIKPQTYTQTEPPELGAVWAEQERLWVITALLDVVAKVNDAAGAKDWDGAWIKEIVGLDVGSATAQDQKSLAKGVALDAAPPLLPPGAPAPEPAPATGGPGGMMPGGPSGTPAGTVYFLKSDAPQPFKVMPVEITVRLDQNRLSEFLVALENSPMAIQVMEPEISKPTAAVVKPVVGETNLSSGGFGGMMGGRGGPEAMASAMGNAQRGRAGGMDQRDGMPKGMGGGFMGGGAAKKGGVDLRTGANKNQERKDKAKNAAAKKETPKKNVDQYFNVIEVTVYGQARFYNTPAPVAPVEASTPAEPAPSNPATPAPAPATMPAPVAPVGASANPANPAAPATDQPAGTTPATPGATPAPTAPETPAPTPAPAPATPAPGAEPPKS